MSQPRANIEIRERAGRREVFDIVRGRFVALTPEEWVRQNVIRQLQSDCGCPIELMQVEGTIALNGMTRRCDIVVYDRLSRPWMIVECKRETVPLSQAVLDQASRYNAVLRVPYLLITNGSQQICCQVDTAQGRLTVLDGLPEYVKDS